MKNLIRRVVCSIFGHIYWVDKITWEVSCAECGHVTRKFGDI